MLDINELRQQRLTEIFEFLQKSDSQNQLRVTIEPGSRTRAIIQHNRQIGNSSHNYVNTHIMVDFIRRREGDINHSVLRVKIHHETMDDIKIDIQSDKKVSTNKLIKIRVALIQFEHELNQRIDIRHSDFVNEVEFENRFKSMFPNITSNPTTGIISSRTMYSMERNFELCADDSLTNFRLVLKGLSKEQVIKIWEILNTKIVTVQEELKVEEKKKKPESRFELIDEELI